MFPVADVLITETKPKAKGNKMKNLPKLKQLMEKPVALVDIATFAALLHASRNRFFRVVWESNQNKRLKKTGEGAQYKEKEVTKLYVATMRNDYSFHNSVINELKRKNEMEEAADWEPEDRTWGEHVPHTPFVVHQVEGEPNRLYGHFLPAINLHTGSKAYHEISGETGYYVDGEKANDKTLKALEYSRKAPTTELDKARMKVHPVNARLDDVLWFKIAGKWYRMRQPTDEDIENLTAAALEFSAKVESEVAAA